MTEEIKKTELLVNVYEDARSVLRYIGVDKDKIDEALTNLDNSVEEVKKLDAGNQEDLIYRGVYRTKYKIGDDVDIIDMSVSGIIRSIKINIDSKVEYSVLVKSTFMCYVVNEEGIKLKKDF